MVDQADKLRVLASQVRSGKPRTGAITRMLPESVQKESKRARVVAVASGKGGVGKTNIAVNLALSLCKLGQRVVLFDADLGLANADVLLGLNPRHNLTHFFHGGKSLIEIMSEGPLGLRVIASGNGLAQLADLGEPERDRLLSHFALLEDNADWLVVDTGAGISRNVIAFAQAADEVIVITTPEPTARLDAYGLIKTLAASRYEGRIRLLVNMAEDDQEGVDTAKLMETLCGRFLNMQVDSMGVMRRDRQVNRAVSSQTPFSIAFPDSQASQLLLAIAGRLSDSPLPELGGMGVFLKRLGALWNSGPKA